MESRTEWEWPDPKNDSLQEAGSEGIDIRHEMKELTEGVLVNDAFN